MGGDRAPSATAQVRRTAAQDRSAGGDGRHSLPRIRRLPMADAAQGFSATTVQGDFDRWRDSRLWETINHLLVLSARVLEGREASPTAGVIDSQRVKTS